MKGKMPELRAVAKTLLTLFALLLLAAAQAAAQTTTVILVRHGEKAGEGEDPVLSEAGARRAQALADALADAGVQAIYTTQYQRTVQTAAPLASRLQVTPVVVNAGGADHARAVAARVRENAGKTVLVVGHSNTVPAIIAALGGPTVSIADPEYHHMFVLQLADDGVRLIRGRY